MIPDHPGYPNIPAPVHTSLFWGLPESTAKEIDTMTISSRLGGNKVSCECFGWEITIPSPTIQNLRKAMELNPALLERA